MNNLSSVSPVSNQYKMTDSTAKLESLLHALRAEDPSNSVANCDVCQLMGRIVCPHLSEEQYALLKAGKRKLETENDIFRVYECGCVWRAGYRCVMTHRGPKETGKGLCAACWRCTATDGRRMRLQVVGERRYQGKARYRARADDSKRRRQAGTMRRWRVRGWMIGKVQI